ncbi:hypothetical protein HOLleu_24357 [Holothuria leucospilota]|uniref:Uncharacterized protein n=1 Tax=Holothuria leucospilota TaxID=206669 RepID=A0A9Q1H692_HOLLE|nr:hypothetical protein HOLleu_24357 [Holothuria leucospilota]
MFRRSNDGPFYRNPEVVSVIFLSVYTLNMLVNVAWVLLSNHDLIEVALAAMVCLSLTLGICLVDFHIRMNRHVKKLATEHKIDLFLFRFLLENGVAMYATWCIIAMLLNLTIVLIYSLQITQTIACTTVLSILAVVLLIYVALDLYFFERYLRYTFSTYVTIMWALVGSLAVNWDMKKPHSIMSMIVLVLTSLALGIKAISTIINSQRKPLYTVEKSVTGSERT